MFLSINKLPNNIPTAGKPDPKAAQALQEGLGGQFGEMRTMMQYLFQNMNFRGDAKPYQDLLRSIAAEEMGHVELVAGQSSRPVDAAGNPWSATCVYDSGNLVLNMIYNLMLEATGRLQKCRLYEMSNNKAFRATVSYLIVRDLVHEKVFAKALETLGVNWNKALPIPKIDTSGMPEVKELESRNLHNQQWTFTNETSGLAQIFKGSSPFDDGVGKL